MLWSVLTGLFTATWICKLVLIGALGSKRLAGFSWGKLARHTLTSCPSGVWLFSIFTKKGMLILLPLNLHSELGNRWTSIQDLGRDEPPFRAQKPMHLHLWLRKGWTAIQGSGRDEPPFRAQEGIHFQSGFRKGWTFIQGSGMDEPPFRARGKDEPPFRTRGRDLTLPLGLLWV